MNAAALLFGAGVGAFTLHHTNAGFTELDPIDCTVPSFNEILHIPADYNVTKQITQHIGRKIVTKSLKAAFWPFSGETIDSGVTSAADQSVPPPPSWEGSQNGNDRLMGQQSLVTLKEKLEKELNEAGLWSQIFSDSQANQELTDYLESSYVENVIDNILGDIQVHVLPNLTVTVRSSMVNLGEVVCEIPEDYSFIDKPGDESSRTRENHICATHAFIKQSLVCNSRTNVTSCNNKDTFPSYDDRMISCAVPNEQNFEDFKFDANRIHGEDLKQIGLEQGNLDRWLLNGVNVLYQFAKYDSACGGEYDKQIYLPGWDLVSAIEMDYDDVIRLNQTRKSSPFSVLLKHPSTCDFVVLNRGSLFKSDWMLDFDYELVPFKSFDGNDSFGQMTKGYAAVSQDTARNIAADIRGQNCTEPRSITIAGHSMGGVIGGGQALLLKSLYSKTDFNLIAFGAPSSIDQQLANNIVNELTVTRSWTLEFDPVTQIPCHNMMPFCDEDSTEHKTATYTPLPNTIKISNEKLAEPMPSMNQKSFGTITYDLFTRKVHLDKIQFPAPTLVAQTHTCAYTCWFDHKYCSSEKADSICKMCSQL